MFGIGSAELLFIAIAAVVVYSIVRASRRSRGFDVPDAMHERRAERVSVVVVCDECGRVVNPAAGFCESCGRRLGVSRGGEPEYQEHAVPASPVPSRDAATPDQLASKAVEIMEADPGLGRAAMAGPTALEPRIRAAVGSAAAELGVLDPAVIEEVTSSLLRSAY